MNIHSVFQEARAKAWKSALSCNAEESSQ